MMNIIQVKLPADANNANGKSRVVASDVKPAARVSPAASSEASPNALEIADRVVEPTGGEKLAPQSEGGGHHH